MKKTEFCKGWNKAMKRMSKVFPKNIKQTKQQRINDLAFDIVDWFFDGKQYPKAIKGSQDLEIALIEVLRILRSGAYKAITPTL